jgi:hypothetical protein
MSTTYVLGDSHAGACFGHGGMPPRTVNAAQPSVTMHRVGRDGHVVNFEPRMLDGGASAFVLLYGEVDARCHVGRQVAAGRRAEEVCDALVRAYLATLAAELRGAARVVLVRVPPPMSRAAFEAANGPITHEFPFVGTDADRVRYTALINERLRVGAAAAGYAFADYGDAYAGTDGTLRWDDSDHNVHIREAGAVRAAVLRHLA